MGLYFIFPVYTQGRLRRWEARYARLVRVARIPHQDRLLAPIVVVGPTQPMKAVWCAQRGRLLIMVAVYVNAVQTGQPLLQDPHIARTATSGPTPLVTAVWYALLVRAYTYD